MAVAGNLNKNLYKITIGALKILPMLLSLCAIANTVLSYFGINCDLLSHIGGISFIPLVFLYLVSKVFMFCAYHRIFLHYLLITHILNLADFYIGIPLADRTMFGVYVVITGCFIFLALHFYRKSHVTDNKKDFAWNSR